MYETNDMIEPTYDDTIDWSEYWDETDIEHELRESPSAEHLVDPLVAFVDAKGVPDAYADVGCGPGAAVFGVAERHPETTVVGYDSARSVLDGTRRYADQHGAENVRFERTVLPAFDPGRQFDLVTCFFTLCYVADVERALENLYDAVAPGGYLLLTYHNRYAQSVFRTFAESPHEYLDESSTWDPDTFADRFELVLEGENLLSYERIHEILETWPRSVWSVSEDIEPYGAWRQHPLVYVPK